MTIMKPMLRTNKIIANPLAIKLKEDLIVEKGNYLLIDQDTGDMLSCTEQEYNTFYYTPRVKQTPRNKRKVNAALNRHLSTADEIMRRDMEILRVLFDYSHVSTLPLTFAEIASALSLSPSSSEYKRVNNRLTSGATTTPRNRGFIRRTGMKNKTNGHTTFYYSITPSGVKYYNKNKASTHDSGDDNKQLGLSPLHH